MIDHLNYSVSEVKGKKLDKKEWVKALRLMGHNQLIETKNRLVITG